MVVSLLQNREFLIVNGDPLTDDIIDKCLHDTYATVADLATHTETLLDNPMAQSPMATALMKRISLREKSPVRTWRSVIFFSCFLQGILSSLDSLLNGTGTVPEMGRFSCTRNFVMMFQMV